MSIFGRDSKFPIYPTIPSPPVIPPPHRQVDNSFDLSFHSPAPPAFPPPAAVPPPSTPYSSRDDPYVSRPPAAPTPFSTGYFLDGRLVLSSEESATLEIPPSDLSMVQDYVHLGIRVQCPPPPPLPPSSSSHLPFCPRDENEPDVSRVRDVVVCNMHTRTAARAIEGIRKRAMYVFLSFLHATATEALQIALNAGLCSFCSQWQFGLTSLAACSRVMSWAVLDAYRTEVAGIWSRVDPVSLMTPTMPFHSAMAILSGREYGMNFCRVCMLRVVPTSLVPIFRNVLSPDYEH